MLTDLLLGTIYTVFWFSVIIGVVFLIGKFVKKLSPHE